MIETCWVTLDTGEVDSPTYVECIEVRRVAHGVLAVIKKDGTKHFWPYDKVYDIDYGAE